MLIAHYPLTEDTGGTAYDHTGNGNDGTVTGATQGTVGGILGSTAYDFDGTDDYIELPDLGLNSGISITISAWYNAGTTKDQRILGSYDGTDDIFDLGLTSGGTLTATIGHFGGNTLQLNNVGSYSTGSWGHLSLVYDSSGPTLTLYSGGDVLDSVTGTVDDFSTTDGPWVGARNDSSLFLDGLLSNIRVFDHALTPSEIHYLHQRAFRSRIYTAVKDAGSSISPNIDNAQYTLNGETVNVYVTGSPDSSSPETQAVTLDGTSSFTLSWNSSHQFFQITAVAESTDTTTRSTIDQVDLSS